jgi:hypothetical protein
LSGLEVSELVDDRQLDVLGVNVSVLD